MSITVRGPDGRSHSFQQGTTAADIDRFMRRQYGATPTQRQARASAAQAVAQRNGVTRRTLWERAVDDFRDTFATSAPGQLNRRADPGGDGFDLGDIWRAPQIREGSVLDRGLDRVAGEDRGFLRGTDTTTAADRQERARREGFAVRSRDDSFLDQDTLAGRTAHGAVALASTLTATALDPTSWVSGGRTLLTRAVTQMGVAGGVDAGLQAEDIRASVQDRYSAARTALSVAAGGSFSVLSDLAGAATRRITHRTLRQPEAVAADDLKVGDELFAPTLTTREIEPTPPIRENGPEGVLETQEPARAPSDQSAPDRPSAALPESYEAKPATWGEIDWGSRGSPERAEAAQRHLAGLQRWIKPEEVGAFLKAVDDGLPDAADASRINARWIDWDRVGDPDEVLRFTGALADIFRTTYDHAGDTQKSWDATAQVARQMGVTLSDVIKTHSDITGDGGIAARAGALRDAALASDKAFYDQLNDARAAIARGDRSGVPALADALNRTVVLGAMDAGASAEIARALSYRRHRPDFVQNELQGAMDELSRVLNNGEDLNDEALTRIVDQLADAYEAGGSSGLRQRIGKMREMGFWDYVGYAATANLLSAPTTHIRNAFGTPIHALFQVGERYVAAGIGALRTGAGLGSRERVTFREATAYTSGLMQSWGEALALAGTAFKRGAPVADARSSVMSSEMAANVPFQFSRDRLQTWAANPLSLKTAGDAFGVALFETMRTLGFRPSVATDEFYKALARRAELNALAYREAAYRAALAEPEASGDVFARTLEALQAEPSAAAFREARVFAEGDRRVTDGVFEPGSREEEMALIFRSIDHRQMAVDHAQLLTFQTSGPIVDAWDKALKAVPIVKHLWVNFVRTPVALLKAGLVARNPVVGAPVAALELTTKAGREKHRALFAALASEEAALERGGAEADLILARQLVGAGVLSTFWMLWASGNVVGKQSPDERRSGVQDYSVRLPDGTWLQFTGMSPVGEMLGLVADTATAVRDHDLADDGAAAIVGALAAAIRNNVVNKSFLKGVSDFMEMMTGGGYGATTDEASGTAVVRQLGEAVAPRMIPGGALLRRIAQEQDPIIRDVRSFTDMILAGVPIMSESVAARRDFLGRPMVRPAGQRGVFQAFNTSSPAEDPLERELGRLAETLPEGFRIGMTPRKMNGEDLTPQEYSRLLEVQGQLYRDPRSGRNLEEELRHLVSSGSYKAAEDEARAFQVKRIIERYRTAANRAVRSPRSPYFMRDAAVRTGSVRLREETGRRQWSRQQALRKSLDFGLDPEDPEVQELHDALFPEG